jgi:hypothetical protein
MSTQREAAACGEESVIGLAAQNGQPAPTVKDHSNVERHDWPGRNESLMERLLNNLRLALSSPHV